MKTVKTGLCIVAASYLFVQGLSAAPASVLLEQGIYTEETVGDLPRAIEIYSEIVADNQANRKYVAEALFRMGRCYESSGQTKLALEELKKLVDQYPDQEELVKRANRMIAELSPPPLFPELEGCRLKYAVVFQLKDSPETFDGGKFSFHQTDLVVINSQLERSLEGTIDRFEFTKIPIKDGQEQPAYPVQHFPGTTRSMPAQSMEEEDVGLYRCRLVGFRGDDAVTQYVCMLEIKPVMYSQLSINEILPNGDIRFHSAQQTPDMRKKTTTRGFINSDFVHIEKMFDADGDEVEFTEKHEGSIYRYRATLNEPVLIGETLFLGTSGTKERLVSKVGGNEFRYRMNHTPGVNVPTHRVEIYRLPEGAKLLSTTPGDLSHRVLEDGRVELLMDTVIPAGGSLLTDFRYQLVNESDNYVRQIAALKKNADSKDKREALEQIEAITANATFHQGALGDLAKLVPAAEFNHQRIVKAAELASTFGYHTGALAEVAKVAAKADHECPELDSILELVVLKLGGTPLVVQLARDAVEADSSEEKAVIHSRITELQQSADYQTLTEAREGQKSLLDSGSTYKPLELQPAPWKDGDALRFRLLTKTGMEMGHLIWAVDGTQHEGKACWKVEQRLVVPSAGSIMASHVVAEKESFKPISGRTTHQLGTVDATYIPGKVLLQHKGADAPREVKVPDPVYDNEQVIFLMRRLPLAEKYSASFPIISVLSGASGLECRIRVLKRETIDIGSESRDCWKIRIQVYMGAMKAVEQTAWFTVEDHVPVRFVTDQMDMELAEHSVTAPDVIELVEHGAAIRLPKDWFGYELPAVGKDSEIVRLLPPDMKLEGLLCKTVRQPASMGVSEIVAKDSEVLKGYFKNYTVRKDTVAEKDINGMPAYIYAADYEDQGKEKVEYRAYYVADSRVFWFVFRVDADQFDAVKAELDKLIEGLKPAE